MPRTKETASWAMETSCDVPKVGHARSEGGALQHLSSTDAVRFVQVVLSTGRSA